MRKKTGLSGDQIASKAGWSRTHVWRMETGHINSPVTDVIHYLVLCGMTEPEMQDILELARLGERKQDYWLSDKRVGGSLGSLIFHESAARRSIHYDSLLIPGLLQTPAYARARISCEPGITKAEIDAAVSTRMERQRILYGRSPAQFTFIINEQVLWLQVGGPRVMQEQLLRLVLMSALGQVGLRIVPSAIGERSVFGGPFALTAVSFDEERSRSYAAKLADEYDRKRLPDVAQVLAEKQLQRPAREELPQDGVVDRRPIYQV